MTDFRLLNGGKKFTVIETFDSKAILVRPGQRIEFESLEQLKKNISDNGLEINIEFIFGSSIQRQIQDAKGGSQCQ